MADTTHEDNEIQSSFIYIQNAPSNWHRADLSN